MSFLQHVRFLISVRRISHVIFAQRRLSLTDILLLATRTGLYQLFYGVDVWLFSVLIPDSRQLKFCANVFQFHDFQIF